MIIGLSGYGGCGKDTAARALMDELGYEKLSFADPLRAVMEELNPLLIVQRGENAGNTIRYQPAVTTMGYERVKQETDARSYLVALGDGMRRLVDPDVWVRPVVSRVLSDPGGLFVVTDVRYANEARAIRQLGGVVWGIVRPEVIAASEAELVSLTEVSVDRVVRNTDKRRFEIEAVHCALSDAKRMTLRRWLKGYRADFS